MRWASRGPQAEFIARNSSLWCLPPSSFSRGGCPGSATQGLLPRGHRSDSLQRPCFGAGRPKAIAPGDGPKAFPQKPSPGEPWFPAPSTSIDDAVHQPESSYSTCVPSEMGAPMPVSSPYAVFRAEDLAWPPAPLPSNDPLTLGSPSAKSSPRQRSRPLSARPPSSRRSSPLPPSSRALPARSRAKPRPCESGLLQGELLICPCPGEGL